MLKLQNSQSGFTVIEMVVASAVLIILTAVVVPGFDGVMRSFQVRNAGEALLNGIQIARGEAISRNQNVEFVLLGAPNTSWEVKLPAAGNSLDSRAATEGSSDVALNRVPAGATTVTFNALGGVVGNSDGSATLTQMTVNANGTDRTLRVDIGPGGRPKLCNPNRADGPTAC